MLRLIDVNKRDERSWLTIKHHIERAQRGREIALKPYSNDFLTLFNIEYLEVRYKTYIFALRTIGSPTMVRLECQAYGDGGYEIYEVGKENG